MTDLTPFTVSIDDTVIQDLKSRLNATRWPDEETVDDWTQGVPLAYQKQLIAYWADEYDHQRLADRLNAYDNYTTELNGLDIHFLHVRSSHAHARPLLLSHGWFRKIFIFVAWLLVEHVLADRTQFCHSQPQRHFLGRLYAL